MDRVAEPGDAAALGPPGGHGGIGRGAQIGLRSTAACGDDLLEEDGRILNDAQEHRAGTQQAGGDRSLQ